MSVRRGSVSPHMGSQLSDTKTNTGFLAFSFVSPDNTSLRSRNSTQLSLVSALCLQGYNYGCSSVWEAALRWQKLRGQFMNMIKWQETGLECRVFIFFHPQYTDSLRPQSLFCCPQFTWKKSSVQKAVKRDTEYKWMCSSMSVLSNDIWHQMEALSMHLLLWHRKGSLFF